MIIRPLAPVDSRDADRKVAHDHAKGGWSIIGLERMLADCDEQPFWRARADLACSYVDNVDNEQLTPAQKHAAQQHGIPARAINLIGRVINGVLGQEAKSRRDPALDADDEDFNDVSDVLNVKLKEAQRETMADMNVSAAYRSQVCAGVGWTEVRRNTDPFKYPYAVEFVPRDQMWWDWRARAFDLADARWVCRSQWKDLDEVIAAFPQHREVIKQAVNGWAAFFNEGPIDESIRRQYGVSDTQRFRTRSAEWRDGMRERIKLYNVQYRVAAEVVILRVGHRKIIVDQENPLHMEAISRGLGKLERSHTMQIRNAIYAGPFRLVDEPTQLKRFKFTPFFAFRRDADDTPYGLVESMLAPQDDYNDASQRVRWMLRAQQVHIDSDAADEDYNTVADIAENAMRPNATMVLNPNRRNPQFGVQIKNDLTLQKELMERMADSRMLVQDVPGVYGPQLGDAPTGVTSGIAMNTLVEQGIVAMGELNDNYLLGRRLTYENLFDLIVEDHLERDLQVKIGSGKTRRMVVLNTRNPETGEAMNVVKDAPVKLGLGEAPSSPAYQMQLASMVGEMIRSLAGTPHAGILIPSWVETNSMFGPGRKQMADDMRQATGMPTAGDREGAQQWQNQQQQLAAKNAAVQAAGLEAELAKKTAEADKVVAETGKVLADTEQVQSQTVKNMAEISAVTVANEDEMIEAALRELDSPQPA
jgi:hypothetical protein